MAKTILERIKRAMKNNDMLDNTGIISLDEIDVEEVQWLWYPYIPLGKITILYGNPGRGKTFVAIQLASIISSGKEFPCSDGRTKKGNVLFLTAEDGLADTIKSRLEKAGADCKRILTIDEGDKGLTLDDTRLRNTIAETRPKLVIIDPLQAYFGERRNMNSANEVRPVMARLGKLAEEFGCAIVLITHFSKTEGRNAIHRMLGSVDFAASVRSMIAVCDVPEHRYRRALVHTKSNLAPTGQTIIFELAPVKGFSWEGTSDLTDNELFSINTNRRNNAPAQAECMKFLKDMLSDGPQLANFVYESAEKAGLATATLNRAKDKMCIGSKYIQNKNGKMEWYWLLPKEPNDK